MPRIIDVHHHFRSPSFVARHGDDDRRNAPKFQHTLELTVDDSIAELDKAGVDVAILSYPNIWYPNDLDDGRATSRELNEFAAEMQLKYPGRLGLFSALPFPDVDGSLAEIEYTFDTLGADGIGIITNYDDVHLGDARYAPIFDELNRRSAVVYVHAGSTQACMGLVPGLPPHALELPFDTARTIASLLFAGAFSRWPNIRFIFSHGAGAFPMVAHRLAGFVHVMPDTDTLIPDGPFAEIDKLFVDTASMSNAPAMAAMRALFPAGQILYGTDYPFRSPAEQLEGLRSLGIPADELAGIEGGNAARLFPQYA